MLDLAGLPTTALMHLSQCNPKHEGSGVCWDLKISMAVEDKTEAEIINKYIPGALHSFAESHSRGSATVNGGFDIARVSMSTEDGEHLASAHAEIRSAKINVKQESGTLVVSIRVYGLVEEAAMKIAYSLDQHINLTFTEQSGAEGSVSTAPKRDEDFASYEGKLITAQVGQYPDLEVVCGIVVSQLGNQLDVSVLQSEETVSINTNDVAGSISSVVLRPTEDMKELLVDYCARCDANGVKANWTSIVQALGELYTSDPDLVQDGGWAINQRVLDHAFAVASAN